ncbi:MAG: TonB-dependent receptor [Saprospiraceae bacterium]|nr:TonB-dependent receptor [Saprospiraceae bacterium]
MQLLPGVSGTNESSSGLYVRGGTPDQNLIILDGFTVYHVDHLFGFFSAFNSSAIKDIQLHKGGFEAPFGGRISSVVEMTGKDGNTKEFNAGAGLSLLSYNAYVESPFADGKGSVLIAARRSFQSKFYSNLFDAFTGISENNQATNQRPPGGGGRFSGFGQQEVKPNSYFYDLNTKLTYRPSTRDVISLSFYNGQDNLDNSRNLDNTSFRGGFGGGATNFSFNSDNVDLSNWGNIGSSLKWSRRWNDVLYSKITTSYSNYFSERDRRNQTTVIREDSLSTRNTGSYENNDLRDFTIKIDNEYKLSKDQQLDFGFQSTYNDIFYNLSQNDTTSVIHRDNQGHTSSFYLQDRISLADRLILKGGLRNSYYSLTSKLYFEPRASMTYLISKSLKGKLAYGKYFQFASRIVREDIQQGSRDFWALADDKNIPIASAKHFITGLSYENRSWLFDVEAYHKDLNGLSEYSTRIAPAGRGPGQTLNYEEYFYTGSGIAQGIELLVQKKAGNFNGWIGYTLGRVLYDFEAFGTEPFHANQDQTHELKIIGSYKFGRWNFASTFIYATGRSYTAPTGYYELKLIDGNTESLFEVSSKNGLRLPDYHRFDLSATYHFFLGSSRASMGLSLINLYNRRNIWYKEYEVVEGELYETNVSLIDFTPSLFITWDLK